MKTQVTKIEEKFAQVSTPDIITEDSKTSAVTETNNNKSLSIQSGNYSLRLLEGTFINPVGPFASPLCMAGSLFHAQGFTANQIKFGLSVLITLNSARFHEPLAMEVQAPNYSAASAVVDLCKKMTPKNAVMELTGLNPKRLFSLGINTQGKTLIGFDAAQFSKSKDMINMLLNRGLVSDLQIINTPHRVGLEEISVSGPFGCLLIAKKPDDMILTHSSALSFCMEQDPQPPGQDVSLLVNNDQAFNEVETARIRWMLQRIVTKPVEIPFIKQISDTLSGCGCVDIAGCMQPITRAIKIITLLNNPPAPSEVELWADTYNVSVENMAAWLEKIGITPPKEIIPQSEKLINSGKDGHLVATKVDYYYAWMLLDGLLSQDRLLVNDRQWKVFETIKKCNQNLARRTAQKMEEPTDTEMVNQLMSNTSLWVKKDLLCEKYKEFHKEEIPYSTLEYDLQRLLELDVVNRTKLPKRKEFVYVVTRSSIDNKVKLPAPTEIVDPVYKKRVVEVVNPITGEVEKF